MEANEMTGQEPAASLQEKDKKAIKKEKKELKDLMGMERTSLALDRTLLAMVRTSTTFMTFGFAIYKLMQERAKLPGEHPIVQIFTPKSVALILFVTGFIGLMLQLISVSQTRKRLALNERGFWKTPVALLSYVILFMLALLITGVIIGRE